MKNPLINNSFASFLIVEKGYTLSQFIDFVKNKQHDESVISFEKAKSEGKINTVNNHE